VGFFLSMPSQLKEKCSGHEYSNLRKQNGKFCKCMKIKDRRRTDTKSYEVA